MTMEVVYVNIKLTRCFFIKTIHIIMTVLYT